MRAGGAGDRGAALASPPGSGLARAAATIVAITAAITAATGASAAPPPDPAAFAMPGGVLAAPVNPVPSATDPLGTPGSYSFAPPSILAGGVAEQSFGSNGARSSAIGLHSGVTATGTQLFVSAGTARTPHWHDLPGATVTAVSGGVQQALPFGTLSVGVTTARANVAGRGW